MSSLKPADPPLGHLLRRAFVLALLLGAACTNDRSGTIHVLNYTTPAWNISITSQSRSYTKRIAVSGSDGAAAALYPPFDLIAGTYTVTATAQGSGMTLVDTLTIFKFNYECAILPNGGGLLHCAERLGNGSPPSAGSLLGPR